MNLVKDWIIESTCPVCSEENIYDTGYDIVSDEKGIVERNKTCSGCDINYDEVWKIVSQHRNSNYGYLLSCPCCGSGDVHYCSGPEKLTSRFIIKKVKCDDCEVNINENWYYKATLVDATEEEIISKRI